MANTYYTSSDRLNSIDISPGNVIYVEDTRAVYVDNNEGNRQCYALVVDLRTEANRTALRHPYNAIYFVQETGMLYKYVDGEWVPLNANSTKQIVFDAYEDFPTIGLENRIYVDELNMYRWRNGKYNLLNSQHDEWGPIAAPV